MFTERRKVALDVRTRSLVASAIDDVTGGMLWHSTAMRTREWVNSGNVLVASARVAYTYWDYEQRRLPAAQGMAIDLALRSATRKPWVSEATIDHEPREVCDVTGHAPVIIELGDARG